MLSLLKKFFSIDKLDEEDEKRLEHDVETYQTIINTSKYADSNSNTEALERLVKALKIDSDKNPSQNADKESVPEGGNMRAPNETEEVEVCQPMPEDKSSVILFKERLAEHMRLLKILDGQEGQILPGQPVMQPERFGKAKHSKKFVLRQFKIPDRIFEAIERNNQAALHLNKQLTIENYIDFFQALLWVEEAHQAIEMHRYDMKGVLLGKYDYNFFVINVPGLAEGRPSLMRGDKLLLKSDKRVTSYEGYIHDVREHDILVKLHASLHSSQMDGLKFDVTFLESRTSYRRCHHGVMQFFERAGTKDIIFPIPTDLKSFPGPLITIGSDNPSELHCVRANLNEFQRKAVINILKGYCRPAPYIIFGPPGTGKTVTLVEAVLQVYSRRPDFKILVCANSNSAADLCSTRILESGIVPREELLRISAFYRMEKMIPPELEDVTRDTEMIGLDDIDKSRVIVTTCVQSCVLNDYAAQFDYVFIDEAGHANEAESLISISLLKNYGCCVLAGDHQQLGPVCMSKIASQAGLGTSLLERLARRSVYQRQVRNGKMAYDERYLTKLIISYRADPRVMAVNNKLFYDNELRSTNKTPQKWLDYLKVEKPLVFHAVVGRDRREYLNPSWFNPNEAIKCLTYAKRLYDFGLKPEQLGIITPYRRQIEKLKILFNSCSLKPCKIATMEEFQGDEREVIIISTVRTREKNLEMDQKFQLGFLFSPKRFNVAVSRAKWLVIVVGDIGILSRDACWQEYLKEAERVEDSARIVVI